MKKTFIITLHAGYWILYLLLITLLILFLQAGGIRQESLHMEKVLSFLKLMSTFTVIPGIVSFYVFYFLLFERFLSKKKMSALFFAGLLTILVAGLVGFTGLNMFTKWEILKLNGLKEISYMIGFMSALALIHGIIALVMKGFITWYGDIKIKETLKQKNFETELALVKMQLSPHFLFNTINNIDVLIEKDAKAASAYLNKLSDMMRFMLYETKAENLPLQQELSYIDKYIGLQKIRSANVNFVKYTVDGDPGGWMIAPMLFIPFIENAFKHSANKKADNGIVIKITANPEKIDFFCENSFSNIAEKGNEPGGLGNDLIQKRLELLYPGKHRLQTETGNNLYKVQLSIYRNENKLYSSGG